MRDKLVGYVLGALEEDERRHVEQQISRQTELQHEVELLRRCVAPLDADAVGYRPPGGLVQRTCQLVAAHRPAVAGRAVAVEPGSRPLDHTTGDGRRRWSLADLAVAAGILIAASLLLLPAINHSRFNARVTACQNNLQQLGTALHKYSQQNHGRIPEIPDDSGRLAVASIYAPKLLAAGLVTDPSVFVCADRESEACSQRAAEIPEYGRLVELERRGDDALDAVLEKCGGSYGYYLGYFDHGRYQTASLAEGARPHFVLMADAPCPTLDGRQSSNHGGHGQNVLFEDGHVTYLTGCQSPGTADEDFYHNDDRQVAAGKHSEDAVVGFGCARPRGTRDTSTRK